MGGTFLAPTPSVRQPLFETYDKNHSCNDFVLGRCEALQLEPGHWEVATGSYKATIQDGQLVSLRTVEGMELLDRKYGKPLDLSFWRHPTQRTLPY